MKRPAIKQPKRKKMVEREKEKKRKTLLRDSKAHHDQSMAVSVCLSVFPSTRESN